MKDLEERIEERAKMGEGNVGITELGERIERAASGRNGLKDTD